MSLNPSVTGKKEQNKAYTVTSRAWVAEGSDVYVKEFTLREHEGIPWHHHSEVFDVFYCLEGKLNVYQKDVATGKDLPTISLSVGESAKVEVGTAHRPYNPGPGPMRFVIVQGVGKYDFKPYK